MEWEETAKKKRLCFLGDFTDTNSSQYTPEQLVEFMKLAKTTIRRKNQKIKQLSQKTRRLDKKIQSLSTLVEHLRNEKLASPEAASSILVGLSQYDLDIIEK